MSPKDDPECLVLFDIDGTLLWSGGAGTAASKLAFQEVFGVDPDLGSVNFAGSTDLQIMLSVLAEEGLSEEEVLEHLADFQESIANHLERIIGDYEVVSCPGAPELLAALAADPHVMLGLSTGNVESIAPIKLRAAGYEPGVFKVGAYGSEVADRNRLPGLAIERAREVSGVPFSGRRVIVIGDTPADVLSAQAAGVRSLAVATGRFKLEELAKLMPDYLFATLEDTGDVLAAVLDM